MSIHQYITKWNEETSKFDGSFNDFAHGTTIYVGSRSTQIMSDVWGTELYAQYWDEESKTVKTVSLDVYEWGRSDKGYGSAEATVDATDEVWQKVEQYYTELSFRKLYRAAEIEASKITKDSIVHVYAGRTAKGTRGKVAVIIERPYSTGWSSSLEYKLGIATSDVMVERKVGDKVYLNHRDIVWVWQRNCKIAVLPSIDETPIAAAAAKEGATTVANFRKSLIAKAA